jgi:RNA-directed DNA polymerase
VAKPQERKFLGFSFTGGKEPKRKIAPKAIHRFKERVREITLRSRGVSMAQMIQELARFVVGWRGYFAFCETPWVLRDLDSWTRRRVRCAFWRQWKTSRRRYAELVRRGVGTLLAHCTAGSNHGPWYLSRSQALSFALPNAGLKSLGVPAGAES